MRAGAKLGPEEKKRLAAITERLASLGTQFSQNVLADEKSYQLVLDGEADLEGLPSFLREAAAQAAEERGLKGKHVITLSRSSIEPFLQFSKRRDLREQAFKAWAARGDNGNATDNKAIIAETAALRAERAKLLGYETFADFKLADTMAKTPGNVLKLLDDVWAPAIAPRRGRARRPAGPGASRSATTSPSSRGTGAIMPIRCAWRATISTRRRSSLTSSSTASSRLRSKRRNDSSG